MLSATARVGMAQMVAAALAIGFLGEEALKSNAASLVERTRRVAFGATDVGAGVLHELEAAADDVENADAARRSAAVLRLRSAATTFERAPGVRAEALRVAASDLARACVDHQVASDALDEVLDAPKPQDRPPWWSWRRWTRHHRAPAENMGLRDPLLESSPFTIVAAEFLAKSMPTNHLMEKACDVVSAVAAAGVEYDLLSKCVVILEKAQKHRDSTLDIVVEMGKIASELEQLAICQLKSLREPTANLVMECENHKNGAAAMVAVLDAAARQTQEREGAGVQSGRPDARLELLGQRDERRSPMLGYAMLGALPLISSVSQITGKSWAL